MHTFFLSLVKNIIRDYKLQEQNNFTNIKVLRL